jgi:hypothetical protein
MAARAGLAVVALLVLATAVTASPHTINGGFGCKVRAATAVQQ